MTWPPQAAFLQPLACPAPTVHARCLPKHRVPHLEWNTINVTIKQLAHLIQSTTYCWSKPENESVHRKPEQREAWPGFWLFLAWVGTRHWYPIDRGCQSPSRTAVPTHWKPRCDFRRRMHGQFCTHQGLPLALHNRNIFNAGNDYNSNMEQNNTYLVWFWNCCDLIDHGHCCHRNKPLQSVWPSQCGCRHMQLNF